MREGCYFGISRFQVGLVTGDEKKFGRFSVCSENKKSRVDRYLTLSVIKYFCLLWSDEVL